jgi:hypothetical protein
VLRIDEYFSDLIPRPPGVHDVFVRNSRIPMRQTCHVEENNNNTDRMRGLQNMLSVFKVERKTFVRKSLTCYIYIISKRPSLPPGFSKMACQRKRHTQMNVSLLRGISEEVIRFVIFRKLGTNCPKKSFVTCINNHFSSIRIGYLDLNVVTSFLN